MGRLPWAGSEELWSLAAMSLAARGEIVNAWLPAWRGQSVQQLKLQEQGVSVKSYGFRNQRIGRIALSILPRISNKFCHLPYLAPARSKLGDLVLVSQGAVMDGSGWLSHLLNEKVNYAVLCQANSECQWPNDEEVTILRKNFLKAKMVYFVSHENERLFRIQTGYTGTNTRVIWNPIQPGTPNQILPWPEYNDGKLRLAVVGRMEPFAKGQDLVLEIMSRNEWINRNVEVTFYGKGPWQNTAERIIRDRKLINVKVGGYTAPVNIWEKNHALLMPSRHEGKALAMLESMWLGRPVVATAIGGASEEVIDGITGFLCAAPSLDLFAETMERMWESRDKLQFLGRNAAKRLRTRMPNHPGEEFAEELIRLNAE